VNLIPKQSDKKTSFTIVELLTVMSIIIVLIGLLVPALNRVRRYAKLVKQKAQFHSIGVALDLFNAEYDGYPDSNERDEAGLPYCGAMKLCEAMVGQDLRGFHPNSRFNRAGFAGPPWIGMPYPPFNTCGGGVPDPPCYTDNLKARKMYLQSENANAFSLNKIYAAADITDGGYEPNTFVLCDVYTQVANKETGKKMGMPILYYRADATKTSHLRSTAPADLDLNTYDSRDNQGLINLGLPWVGGYMHPMASGGTTLSGALADPKIFYDKTVNRAITTLDRPYREDSYILMSAGFDGQYGTSDDVFNFGE
jgi:type II secretory pathway pseudopilin PulG